MAPAVEDLLTTFHPSGDAFAITAGDGRIKTWDVQNGEMRAEFADIKTTSISGADIASNGHLAMDYSCMAWASLVTHGSAKKKKKGAKGGTSVVVLGTGSGDVVAWDTTLGELKWRTSDCHSGGVKSVAFNKSGLRVFSAGHDGNVCELDSLTGQNLSKFRAAKIPLSCVAVSPDGGTVAAASAELKLFDLSSKKRLRKFPGHPAPVKALLFTPDGKYVLSCAVGERHVAMWQCEGSKADTGVVCSLSLEHPAVTLDCTGFDKEGEVLRIVAVSEGGVAYIWSASTVAELGTAQATTIRTKCTGKGSKSSNSSVLAARFLEDGASVLVVHGISAKPEFEKVVLDSQEVLSITVGATTNGALLPAITAGKDRSAKQEVTVLGPDNAGDALLPRPQIEIASVKTSNKKRRAELEDAEAEPSPLPMEDDTELPKTEDDEAMTIVEEETMEDKLIALNLISDSPEEETMGDDKAMVPQADSLQVLLSQALHSKDNSLIEQCLAVQNEKIISNTIRRLRPADAAEFLIISISKLEYRPQRAINLVPWVRAVLLQHASYLMSNPRMRPVLSSLYQIIEARIATFRPLVSLSGRLDLIMAQISANESQEKDLEELDAAVIYEEEDSEPDAEDAMIDEDLEEDDGDEDDDEEGDEEDAMDEDKTDGQVHGNGNGLSDGEDSEDIDN